MKDDAISEGPVLPGSSVTLKVKSWGPYRLISVAGMLVTTNDAFFAVKDMYASSWNRGPKEAYAWDAGSETNSESCAYIPGPPCGSRNAGDTMGAEGFVHIHSGIHGTGDISAAE